MQDNIKKIYSPMTESAFYILLCLKKPNHGYGIVQQTRELTEGEIIISPGTMYGTLSKMEKDGLIQFVKEQETRKIYVITELGEKVLEKEMNRIIRLYANVREVIRNERD